MNLPRRRALLLAGAAIAGCSSSREPRPTVTDLAPVDGASYTHARPSGNRLIDGRGRVPEAAPVDVDVGAPPAWLLAHPLDDGSLWVAVDGEGSPSAFRVRDGEATDAAFPGTGLPPGAPPALVVEGGSPRLLALPGDASELAHPIPVGDDLLYVARNGDVALRDAGDRVSVDALPDARPVALGDGLVALLADATDRYDHGVLGDAIEAGSVVILDATGGLSVRRRIGVPDGVIEGIAPIAAELGGDLVVTESDAEAGARQAVYGLDGERVAAGPPIGTGYRWRHAIAVAPFGRDGRRELAVVRTPHIGGVAEFYGRDGADLVVRATAAGYSTHEIGSRNLDGGLAADADGDGRVELVAPTSDRRALAGVARTPGGAEEAWRAPVGAEVGANLAATTLRDGRLALGAGRGDGVVRVWQ